MMERYLQRFSLVQISLAMANRRLSFSEAKYYYRESKTLVNISFIYIYIYIELFVERSAYIKAKKFSNINTANF